MAADPVTAFITMCACPPYCVVPELRNQVPIGTFVPSGMPKLLKKSMNSWGGFCPSPCTSATVPWTCIASL